MATAEGAEWQRARPRVDGAAFEPNIVPYEVAAGIEHWVLWHHPKRVPGVTTSYI